MSEQIIAEVEEWRPVKGFEGYFVSNLGRIKSSPRRTHRKEIILKASGKRYLHVSLYRNGVAINCDVYLVVLKAFLEKDDPERDWGNHKDGNKKNNRLENLEWSTPSENTNHAHHVLGYKRCGEQCAYSTFTTAQIIEMRKDFRAGVSTGEIAKRLGRNRTTIYAICYRKNWKHIH